MRRAAAPVAAALALILTVAAPVPAAERDGRTPGSSSAAGTASATTSTDPNALVRPSRLDRPPEGFVRRPLAMGRLADRVPKVRAARAEHPGSEREIFTKGTTRWQVGYYAKVDGERREIAQVLLDDATGTVTEAWTGYQVAWTMARGYDGAFGRTVNSPWIWIPLSLLFVAAFVDRRRPWRVLHLDLLALSAFSVSLAFFNDAQVGTSVPLAYPPLLYLLGRMLWVGLRRRGATERAREPLALLVPVTWLAVGVVFLLGFRIALNVLDSNVIDVGYAGVIGAEKLAAGEALYGDFPENNQHGDTYGPVTYAAYVPFEQALGFSGDWDDLPAAHGAAIAFDLLACLLCFLVGRRIRGPGLGIALAFAWVAYPFTLYAVSTNANDALVAVLVLAALLAATSAPARGALLGLAGLTKFAPLALAPLFATHRAREGGRVRTVVLFALAFAVAAVVGLAPVLLHGDLRTFYERTLGFQADRGSPFSVWGLYRDDAGWVDGLQVAVQVAAAAGAVLLALVPRRRDVVGLAALSAAVLVALQLGIEHWFYLYIPWFFPLVMIALLGRFGAPGAAPAPRTA